MKVTQRQKVNSLRMYLKLITECPMNFINVIYFVVVVILFKVQYREWPPKTGARGSTCITSSFLPDCTVGGTNFIEKNLPNMFN